MGWLLHRAADFLIVSPVLLLFLIIAGGYLLGELRLPGGLRLGTSAVLFAGILMGAADSRLKLPPEMATLGLALFVYCLGLEAGPGFFHSLRHEGLKPNLAIVVAGIVAAATAWGLGHWLGLDRLVLTGIFCGALNNTAALGAAVERAHAAGADPELMVAGYGLAYPAGVLATLILLGLRSSQRLGAEAKPATLPKMVRSVTIKVTRDGPEGSWKTGDVARKVGVLLTRARIPGGKIQLLSPDSSLPRGSLVVVVGRPENINAARELLGENAQEALEDDMSGFEVDRYQISNPRLAGRRLGDLRIESLGAVISRIRRGDVDLPVEDSTVLLLGDRVRAICYKSAEPAVRAFFGNSLQTLTEMGYATFAVGIALGLLLGELPIPIPGLGYLRLGSAGGPLVVALALGFRGRTGHMIWNLPFTTNMALRQLGLIVFLASAGLRAGAGLGLVAHKGFWPLLLVSVAIPTIAHLTLWAVLKLAGERRGSSILGYTCAMQTQPAALTFAVEHAERGRLNLAYATVYPLSFISKIVLAQILLNLS